MPCFDKGKIQIERPVYPEAQEELLSSSNFLSLNENACTNSNLARRCKFLVMEI